MDDEPLVGGTSGPWAGALGARDRESLASALPAYDIGEELGRGAHGVVIAASHRRLGRDVAVKRLAPGLDAEMGARFVAEARVLGSLDHPHVVRIYDYVEVDGQCLLIMERLTGGTVKDRLMRGGLSPREACAAVVAACAGLQYAHSRGVLHRDVKPQNLLLSADGVVKVADFGISKVLASSTTTVTQAGVLLGTPAYMAPEQVHGDVLSPATDVYAAGVVLYELLCAELPFPARGDQWAEMYERLHGDPIPLLERAPRLPAALAHVTSCALQRNPADRYATPGELAGAVAEAATAQWGPAWSADTWMHLRVSLGDLFRQSPAPELSAAISPARRHSDTPTDRTAGPAEAGAPAHSQRPLPAPLRAWKDASFVGRDSDLVRLRRAWARVRAGALAVAMIGGEPGIGKTRLAIEFAQAAHADGAEVFFGRSDEELAIPYQPIAEMLRSYAGAQGQAARIDGELARLVPELAGSPPAAQPAADPATQRYRLFEAVVTFLGELAEARPVVLVVDDLHWADPPTLHLLRYMARSTALTRLLIVGTYRDTEVARSDALEQMLTALHRDGLLVRIALRGLTEQDIEALLAGAGIGEAHPRFVHALHAQTEGNPFFAEEAIRHLAETGAISDQHKGWTDERGISQMGIPEGVKATIRGRLSHLPAPCGRILSHSAVLGRHWEYEVLRAMELADDDVLLDCVEAALAAKLIVDVKAHGQSPAYAFTHALVRETLYEELSVPRRQRLHLRAAQAIERVHSTNLDAHATSLASHLRLAGAAAEAADALRWSARAGELAAAQLAWEDAAAHWDHALALMPQVGVEARHRARLLERMGDLKYAANFDVETGTAQLEEALACYEAAGERSRAARTRSRIGRNLATYWGPLQDIRRAREHLQTAEPVLRAEGDGVPLGSVYIALANAALWANDTRETRRAADRAMGIGGRLGNDALWANAAVLYAWGCWISGRLEEARPLFEEAWERADALNHPVACFLATWSAQGAAGWMGEPREVLRWCDRELAKPRVMQAPGQRELLDSFRGWGAALGGDLTAARAAVQRSPLEHMPFAASVLELIGGAPARAAELCARSMAQSAESGNRWNEMCMGFRLGQAQWLLGDPAMERTYVQAITLAAEGGAVVFELIVRAALVPRLLELGRRDDAHAQLARCRQLFETGGPWGAKAGDLALAEATLAAGDGHVDEAARMFAEAVETFRRFGVVWEEAEAWYRWGAALSPRDPVAAGEKLDAALDIYVRHGASEPWRELVARARQRASRSIGQ